MLRVLLISPDPRAAEENRKAKALFPPLGLATVAGITPPDIDVRIIDEAVEDIDYNQQWDIVGITCNTSQAPRAYEIAKKFRMQKVAVVLGGIHPTALPEEASRYADAVVVGEAENNWSRLLSDFINTKKLQPIYKSSSFPDLKGSRPRRDLYKKNAYLFTNTVQTSRGCPHNCTFCSVTKFFGATYRTRPVKEVIEEVEHLPGRVVIFVDDNITGHPAYARELFKSLKGLNKRWLSQASVNQLKDREIVRLAAESGCRGLLIGFESLSLKGLQDIHKRTNDVNIYSSVIKCLHDHGIGVIGAFIVGLDEEGPDVFEKILEFSFKTKIDLLQVSILTPLPGTPLYEQMEKSDRIFDHNWKNYNGNHVVYYPVRLTPEQLYEGFHFLLRSAYSWRGIFKRAFCLKPHSILFWTMNGVFRKGVLKYLKDQQRKCWRIGPCLKI